eukprot:TRINITY_DN6391_c0_g1_i1.p1 TRINITY_DN6391_c0_g1~~TRINITY_DN6391_c0_g1_i1.p1  ORF type:complete len:291 (+),score=82.68 TRINITY_DN6391_c0_g1_i1:51-923(+)
MSGKSKKAADPFGGSTSDRPSSKGDRRKEGKDGREAVEKLRELHDGMAERAWKVIHEDMPNKILELEEFIKVTPLLDMKNMETSIEALEGFGFPVINPQKKTASDSVVDSQSATSSSAAVKKRKFEKEDEFAADGQCKTYLSTPITCNKAIITLIQILKPKIFELVEMIDAVKMWIQLNIPKIEDGNNFGVSIQEETLAELSKAEESSIGMLETVSRYHMTRGKLLAKVMKYPYLEDYRRCVYELDEKEWFDMRISIIDLKNNYAILLDLIVKNLDKLRTPRTTHHREMF